MKFRILAIITGTLILFSINNVSATTLGQFWDLIQQSNLEEVKRVIDEKGNHAADFINSENPHFQGSGTSLLVAAGNLQTEIFDLLIENGGLLSHANGYFAEIRAPFSIVVENGGDIIFLQRIYNQLVKENMGDDRQLIEGLKIALKQGNIELTKFILGKDEGQIGLQVPNDEQAHLVALAVHAANKSENIEILTFLVNDLGFSVNHPHFGNDDDDFAGQTYDQILEHAYSFESFTHPLDMAVFDNHLYNRNKLSRQIIDYLIAKGSKARIANEVKRQSVARIYACAKRHNSPLPKEIMDIIAKEAMLDYLK